MDLSQIPKLREEIKAKYEARIRSLREEMEAALTSLEKVEQTFLLSAKVDPVEPGLPVKSRSSDPVAVKPSVAARVDDALKKMGGSFTKKELLSMVETDGHGEINKNTFAPTFSKLKGVKITVVTEPHGTQAGIYKKIGEH